MAAQPAHSSVAVPVVVIEVRTPLQAQLGRAGQRNPPNRALKFRICLACIAEVDHRQVGGRKERISDAEAYPS